MLTVVPVGNTRTEAFHAVPRAIYDGRHLDWTPIPRRAEAALFDPRHNPTLARTDVARWVALQDGAAVGRIAASAPQDPAGIGHFGFFETPDDPAVARALLQAAEAWLRERGRQRVFGPVGITPRDQIGLLVEGFDRPAALLTPYNPPYYAALLEGAGYRPSVKLRGYAWRPDMVDTRGMIALGTQISARGDLTIRAVEPDRLEDEASLVARLLNQAFQHVWGYVPITDPEALAIAKNMSAILDPSLCLIALRRGEPCGVALTVPDANWLFRRIHGRWWPFGWLVALWWRRRIPSARFMALGVLPGRRAAGTAVQLMLATHRALIAGGYRSAELSQVFDENQPMRRLLERMGCQVIKRYAVYERALAG
jgi:GNAT superfamily N-acetyltransferase